MRETNVYHRSVTTAEQRPIRAAIYCRISLAALDDTTKVEDQERICRELAARLGWDVADVYTDNNRSAWQKNRTRPEWDRMLADVEAGHVSAIIVYHGDRLVRRPEDLADLIKLADSKGVKLASPTGTHNLDNDRLELWIRAAFAEEESTRSSERRKTMYDRWRREGRVQANGRGGRVWGFESDSVTHVPAEVAVIREAARRVLAGQSAVAIGAALTAEGHRMPTGRAITYDAIRRTLCKPRYAGLMPDGQNKGAWEPVLDRATWEAMCAILDARAGRYAGKMTNGRKYLLSGLATCGPCGEPVQIRYQTRRPDQSGYGCVTPGCHRVQRNREHLDEYVITAVLARLADAGTPPGHVPVDAATAAELRALTEERAAVEEMVKDHRKGRADLLMARLDSLDARISELSERISAGTGAQLLAAHAGITRAQWDDLPLSTRRALVAAAVSVTVLPASRKGPGFREEDVVLGPGSGGHQSSTHTDGSAEGVGGGVGSTGSDGVGSGAGLVISGEGDGDGGV